MIVPRNNAPRWVTCYHCGSTISSTAEARSTSCAACHRRVVLDDLVIEVATMWSGALETCGRVVIGPTARLRTRSIAASESVDVGGDVATRLTSRGLVRLRDGSVFQGECVAACLEVQEGAVIKGGYFEIGMVRNP